MNKTLNILTTMVLLGVLSLPVWGQKSSEKKIKVRIETEENGKKQLFERTYSSKEEMSNDKELQALGFNHSDDPHFSGTVFSKSHDEQQVSIDIDSEADGDKIMIRKVVKDKDGKKKTIKRVYNNLEELKADRELDVEITDGDHGFEWSSDDNDVHIKVRKKEGPNKKTKVSRTVTIEVDDDQKANKKKKEVTIVEEESQR